MPRPKCSTADQLRMSSVNATMRGINADTDDIYESLVDRDYETLKTAIESLQERLTNLLDNIEED